jgi:protease IV
MDIKEKLKLILLTIMITSSFIFGIAVTKIHYNCEPISNIVELKDGKMGLDGEDLINQIKEVLKSNPKEIIIRANSSGGRMVQGEIIYNYINSIEIPVYSYIEDGCLSACYYGISSSDKIFAYNSSEVGNIGVTHPEPKSRFKVFAWSGKYKNTETEKEYIRKHLTSSAKLMHMDAVNKIKIGRRTKIKGTDEQLFEGLIWTGIEAKQFGLIDDIDSIHY